MQASNKKKSNQSSQLKRKGGAPKAPKKNNSSGQASAAAAYATGQSGRGAKVMADRDTCRVIHREFIGNVTGSVAFAIGSSFSVNPGLPGSFPWLSGIARNWEAYRFRKLRLCYYTRTGTGVPGSVIMAHDPDASDDAPASEQIMTTYECVKEDAPWKDICLDVRASSLHDIGPRKFVRVAGLAANQDIKLYDSGSLYVATVDGTAVSWGKLWVEYDVDFYTPQTLPLGSSGGGSVSGATAMSAVNPLGTSPVVDATSVGLTMNNASVLTLGVAGTYIVSLYLGGTTITAIPNPTAGSGCTVTSRSAALINAAGTIANASWIVDVTSISTATLTFSCSAATVTASAITVGNAPANSLL